jgi:hypothetical protein
MTDTVPAPNPDDYDGDVTLQSSPRTVAVTGVAAKVKIALGLTTGEGVEVLVGQGGPTGTIVQLVASNGTVTFTVDGIDLRLGALLCTLLEDDRR